MERINLLLAIHCHQPVGNFGGVFQEAYEKAYLPFIEAIEKHPPIKFALHYSGSLLDWLKDKHPEFLSRVKALVERKQVEIIGGGYYEPILPLIPPCDAKGQIEMLNETIRDLFSYRPKGAWLAERVWEPKIPLILANAGMEYTVVDDSHFRLSGMEPEELNGFYISEEEGRVISIFPTSEKLRYLIPFKLPRETIDYLKNRLKNKEEVTIAFGDDGEKFGLWPGTHKWVYKEGWLEDFLSTLEANSDLVNTLTFSEYLSTHKPEGRIYLSCASYREMLEWSGGFFRNFFVKYPEANNMHKRMLYVSKKLQSVIYSRQSTEKGSELSTSNQRINEAKRHLYMAQANDAYWHGIFGGLYLNHLRFAIYTHLIEAQEIINELLGNKERIEKIDFDCDKEEEVILNSEHFNVYLRPSQGGSLCELDYKPKSLNIVDTIRRRFEPYHNKLKERIKDMSKNSAQPSSIHDQILIKEEGLENILYYDAYPRYCLLDHFLDISTNLDDFVSSRYEDKSDFAKGNYELFKDKRGVCLYRQGYVNDIPIKISKTIDTKDSTLELTYKLENSSTKELTSIFGIEFNFSLYDPLLSGKPGVLTLRHININDLWYGLKVNYQFDKEVLLWHFPVETVSESEAGIERTYQGLCLFFHWELELPPKEVWQTGIAIKVK